MKTLKLFSSLTLTFVFPLIAISQIATLFEEAEITQSKGRDNTLNYRNLIQYGPWDDRNYQLSRMDLDLLAENELELKDPIPVFFRIQLRRNYPNLKSTGSAQYPRSALQIFLREYGGYDVNGKRYNKVEKVSGNFRYYDTSQNQRQSGNRFLTGEIKITSPNGSDESSVKISPVNPDIIIAGTNGPGFGQTMHYSSDGGETWNSSILPLGNTCCDPTVDWSSDGRFAYTATLGNCGLTGCAVWFYRSDDNGVTWTSLNTDTPNDPRRELTNSGSDKEYIHVDKDHNSPYVDNIYMTWHEGNEMQFGRSTDSGNIWQSISFDNDPLGIGSDITTDAQGNIYYLYAATDDREILLKKSTDGGQSFQSGTVKVSDTKAGFDFPIPSMETRRAWIYVSTDADLSTGSYSGSIYATWTDTYEREDESIAANNHSRIQVAFSRDQGQTWSIVSPHPVLDQNTVDRWNPWIAVGRDGAVHLIFYDTRNSPNRTGVDVYYCNSTDGGQTFGDLVRVSSVTSSNLSDAQEFGDYNGLDHVVRQIATFADNRIERTETGDSKDVYAASNPIAQNWTSILSSTISDIYTVHFPNSQIGFAAGANGTVLITEDGGNSWFPSNNGIAKNSYIYSIFFPNQVLGFAVGNRGNVYRTTDGGTVWRRLKITNKNVRDVFFKDGQHGFIIADGELYETTNTGSDWVNINNRLPSGVNPNDLLSSEIYFYNQSIGFILLQSKILKTIDGGSTWSKIDIPGAFATYDIQFISGDIGYLCGIGTGIMKTIDGGSTWRKLNSLPTTKVQSCYFNDEDNGLVIGVDGIIYATDNGGQSWIQQNSNVTDDLHQITFLNASRSYILVGKNGVILRK